MPAGTRGENIMLQYLLQGATATRETSWFVGLSTISPKTDTPGEFTDASYVRQSCVFVSGAINTYWNSAALSWAVQQTTKTMSGVLVYDASTAGNLLLYGALAAASSVRGGTDNMSFATHALAVVLS